MGRTGGGQGGGGGGGGRTGGGASVGIQVARMLLLQTLQYFSLLKSLIFI